MHTYSFHITDRQRNVIEQEYGHRVADPWLKNLPETVSNLCTQWNLTPTGVPDSGSMSACVYVSDTENNHYVLKLPVHPEVSQPEVAALDAWDKQKLAPHIQRYDQETGALLLNRIQPGTPAEPGTGYTDIDTLARVIHTMIQTPLPLTSIPTYRGRVNMRHTWARNRFQQTNNTAGLHLLDKSDALLHTLTTRGTSNKLLHGDLQPKNILLDHDSSWKLIDPLPCVGDPEYDIALWTVSQTHGRRIIDIVQHLVISAPFIREQLLIDWVTVMCVLELRPTDAQRNHRQQDFLHTVTAAYVLREQHAGKLADEALNTR